MGRNNGKYLAMSAVELAQDGDFLRWCLIGDNASDAFWREFVKDRPEMAGRVAEAVRIVGSARMNSERLTCDELRAEVRRLTATMARRRMRRRVAGFAAGFAAAAYIVAAVGAGAFMLRPQPNDVAGRLAELVTHAAGGKVQLVTAAGGRVEIDGGAVESAADGSLWATGDEGRTFVASEPAGHHGAAMNRLMVPSGKRSSVTLPDGSVVWVNAGSTVEFPSRFVGATREIRVDGEVYVEAARDPERPFLLHTGEFTVRVLGTRFNVSAYGGDACKTVVLVDGAVDVLLPTGSPMPLRPDDMLVLENYTARTERVDAHEFISWRDGILNFHGRPLRDILVSVSRYYGVEVECDVTDAISLSGKLLLFGDMETTLNNITAIAPVAWRVEKGKIIIEKR